MKTQTLPAAPPRDPRIIGGIGLAFAALCAAIASCIGGSPGLVGGFILATMAILAALGARVRRLLAERTRDLAERDRFFDLPLDMLCIAGFDGTFKRLNPAWERLLGYRLDMIENVPFMNFVHPDDREMTAKEFGKLLEGGTVRDFENRYRCHDGSYRWLSWTSAPVPEAGLIYAVARDITVRKSVEEDLKRSKDTAESANKELEAFSYSVSHDLRAPLRSIDGFSQVLIDEFADRLDERGLGYLKRVRGAAARMTNLIDDLLNLSKLSRLDMRKETVLITDLANKIAQELRKEQPERKVEFAIRPGTVAEGDPRLLRIALENLLGNAWKYTKNRPLAHIEVGVRTGKGERPAYYVKDDGAGFDMAYASKLFGAFQRLHSVEEFEGTGIGLATVARIVHRHGGQVWAQGEVEKGATFYFTL
jgi:PAS domain S-box-containing protein